MGPVGVILAGLLGRRGVRVVALERDADVYPLPRAAHIDHQGLRVLQELGWLDGILPTLAPNPGLDFVNGERTLLFRIPGNQLSVSGLPASMYFHQPDFDRRLRAAVGALPGVDVRLGHEVIGLEEEEEGVRLEVRSRVGRDSLRANWVAGCDGASSGIRELVGIGLEDLDFDERWVVLDLKLKRPVATLPKGAINLCDPARPMSLVPIPQGRFRFELMTLPEEDPEVLRRPANALAALAGWLEPADAEIERSAVYTFHGLVAREWRRGRVFVAGDAAHQMPPFLGQGLNSGLRDAANLAWKLHQVLSRRAPDRLLDTYGAERRPHVRRIVELAVGLGRLMTLTDPRLAAERDRRWLAGERPVIKLPRLDAGPLVLEGGGELFPQWPAAEDGRRFDDAVGQRFLVLAVDDAALGATAGWWRDSVGALVATPAQLRVPPGPATDWLAAREARVVAVRPDRYVLAAGPALDPITERVRDWLA
jgi:3-(3-hydroxy-phenyl)propionate hydroxylase